MHRCLAIVEIQHAIFRHVRGTPHGTATLARLAHTCRTFSDTALDLLWSGWVSIVCLIRCLPRDLVSIRPGNFYGRSVVAFWRAMSLEDWGILFRYTSRIRHLYVSPGARMEMDVIFSLAHPPHGGPLFPHLESIDWEKLDAEIHTPLFHALITHTLVDVVLPYSALQSPDISTQLTSTCPSLKSLSINSIDARQLTDANGRKILSEVVSRLRSLELFRCQSSLDEAAIAHLSRFPSLVNLSLYIQDRLHLESLIPLAFTSLRFLSLQASTLSTLTPLLKAMHLKLREVSFRVDDIPTPDMLSLFFGTLAKVCDPELLARITFISNRVWISGLEREDVSLSTFQPLFTFPHLDGFVFDVMYNILLDDSAINTLTQCWPRLAEISLNGGSGWGIASQVSHLGLITLLSGCPALDSFTLAVNFSEIDHPHSRWQVASSCTNNGITSHCWCAWFVESVIEFPAVIAAFLRDVCPRLTDVSFDSSSGMDYQSVNYYCDKWKEVNDMLFIT